MYDIRYIFIVSSHVLLWMYRALTLSNIKRGKCVLWKINMYATGFFQTNSPFCSFACMQLESHFLMQIMFTEFIQSGLSTLQNFYSQQRLEILKTLEEEESYIKAVILEVLDKMNQIQIKTELNIEALHHELQNDESECRDVHISCDVNASHMPEVCIPHFQPLCGVCFLAVSFLSPSCFCWPLFTYST